MTALQQAARECIERGLTLGGAQFELGKEIITQTLERYDGDMTLSAHSLCLAPGVLLEDLRMHGLCMLPSKLQTAARRQRKLFAISRKPPSPAHDRRKEKLNGLETGNSRIPAGGSDASSCRVAG